MSDQDTEAAAKAKRIAALYAALGIVRQIKATVARRVNSSATANETESAAYLYEIREAMRLVGDEAAPQACDVILAPLVPPSAEGAPTPWSRWTTALDSVQRLLEAWLLVDGEPAALDVGQPAPSRLAQGQPAPANVDPDADYAKHALVHNALEELLGTSSFKALSWVLLAAVMLAVGGNLFILGQSITIVKNLSDAGDTAKHKISEIQDFATKDITEKKENAVRSLEGLKTQAVQEVLEGLKAQFETDAKPLHDKIATLAIDVGNELNDFQTRSLPPLHAKVQKLATDVTAEEQQQQQLGRALDRLKILAAKIEQIDRDVTKAGNYAESATMAATQAQAAKEHADAAHRHRDEVFGALQGLNQKVVDAAETLGMVKARIDALNKALDGMKVPSPATPVNPTSPPPPPSHPTDADLSKWQWAAIQHGLSIKGHPPGAFDGCPGNSMSTTATRNAIRAWKGTPQLLTTGKLEANDIDVLMQAWRATLPPSATAKSDAWKLTDTETMLLDPETARDCNQNAANKARHRTNGKRVARIAF